MVEMIQRIFVTALWVASVAPTALAQTADVVNGEALFKTCSPCHGSAGEGLSVPDRDGEIHLAPAIAGLPQWYVEAQLVKFQTGARGAHPEDMEGLRMRPMSRALTGDQQRVDVAAYVASLDGVTPPDTVDGDVARGKTLYTPCISCHGPEGQGNKAMNSPPLVNMSDWYVVSSMEKFKAGQRGGAASKDPTGALMRPMAMTLPTDQAVKDVAAYLRTLGN